MNLLRRLTLLDLALFAALIMTGVLLVANRTAEPGPDLGALFDIDNVDLAAWEDARDKVSAAFTARDLAAARSALETAAQIAEQGDDAETAAWLRSLAVNLRSVDIAALEQRIGAIGTFPLSRLLAEIYLDISMPLISPPFSQTSPGVRLEWAHLILSTPGRPIGEFWGTASWYMPDGVPESGGVVAIVFPDLGFDAKLMLSLDGDDIHLSLVFTGLLDDVTITDATVFWTRNALDYRDEAQRNEVALEGAVFAGDAGTIVMRLAPEARVDNLSRLRTADEFALGIDFAGDSSLLLRIEVGDSGRALLAESLAGL